MKKSIILITIISLLLTLFISNITFARGMNSSINVAVKCEKKADKEVAYIGDIINYKVIITNIGNVPIKIIKLIDSLGIEYDTQAFFGVEWRWESELEYGSLKPNESVVAEYGTDVLERHFPSITNKVKVIAEYNGQKITDEDEVTVKVKWELSPEPLVHCRTSIRDISPIAEQILNIDRTKYSILMEEKYTGYELGRRIEVPIRGSKEIVIYIYRIEDRKLIKTTEGILKADGNCNITFYIKSEEEKEIKPCNCSLVVLKRDEAGHPIDGAVFKVDGIEKTIRGGEARWDNLECDTTYEVKEVSPNEQIEGIHLGNCGERSTLRIVNKIEEEVTEETTEEKTKDKTLEILTKTPELAEKIEDDYSKPILRMGSQGYWVNELQKMLNCAVYGNTNILVLDGIFGPKTNHAVVYLQSSCNITVDGIVGPQTWGLLNAVCNQ